MCFFAAIAERKPTHYTRPTVAPGQRGTAAVTKLFRRLGWLLAQDGFKQTDTAPQHVRGRLFGVALVFQRDADDLGALERLAGGFRLVLADA
jgi:hypothetical protein